jgi:steroid 5-alpha reductase family enzyme
MEYIYGLGVIAGFMTLLWIISVFIKDASIVDPFWGFSFVLINVYYTYTFGIHGIEQLVLLLMVTLWGLRLSIHLWIRNKGKGEDFRYQQFRKDYGENRYWWISFFQVFLLQATLAWLVSAPLFAINKDTGNNHIGVLELAGIIIWFVGLSFETIGDYQLTRFKSDPSNKGKLLTTGLWKYTRHPNYFGDAAAWWGFGIFGLAAGGYINFLGAILMTILLVRVSGVMLLEKSLVNTKPGYAEYVARTSAFIPWFPARKKKSQSI